MRRRTLLGGALALGASRAAAQVFPPAGHATPARTVPFAPEVYRERRARLMAAMKTGVAVVYGADKLLPDSPIELATQQESNFAWLTGIVDEPGAMLVLAPAERLAREYLVLPARDQEFERWETERLPLGAELERRTGFDHVIRSWDWSLGTLLSSLTQRHKDLRFLGPVALPSAPVPAVLELYDKLVQRVPGARIIDDSALLPAMRIVKEPREIAIMRKAMDATRAGHLAAMRAVKPGMTERQLKAVLEAAFRAGGSTGLSYESIVATGRNATSLHYGGGDGVIQAGDLVLIDAGTSVGGYASDVTRTFPASGKFSDAQRALYELVLAAHDAAAAKLKAGVYYEDVELTIRDVLRRGGHIDDFNHPIGHLVGVQVHDAGDLSRPLPAGAVVTIEPGIYVQSENYGIRIEDEYLITPTGAERLSAGIPRTVAEIESFMARG